MAVNITEKKKPGALLINQLRRLIAYRVVESPDSEEDNQYHKRSIRGIKDEDVIVCIPNSGYGISVFNATEGHIVIPHQSNSEWRGYKFRRARYVEQIQLTFDADED